MAQLDVQIGGHRYELACRDGDEEHLRFIASIVDARIADAARTMGGLNESRQLLFAALLLADELHDGRGDRQPGGTSSGDLAVVNALERLADRMEHLAQRLENEAPLP